MKTFALSLGACAALCAVGLSAGSASATVYSLSGDFSETANPNGVWSFVQGTTDLTHFAQPTDGNTLNPAAANGYWGVGSNFSSVPVVMQTSQDGSATSPYSNNDFLAGDVIAHSPNSGDPLFIDWTAPTDGTISFTSAVWYAHSPVDRSNDISDILGGDVLGTVTVDNSITRSNAITTLSGTDLTVTAGEVLAFQFVRSPGQSSGSITGISETIDFTPSVVTAPGVPEPATWAMLIVGFAGLGAQLRHRRAGVSA